MAKDNENSDQLKAKRKRSANWDALEKSVLRSSIRKYVSIIENKSTDTNTNKNKTVAWHAVAKRFNEINYRKRSVSEIRQQWRTMKVYARMKKSGKQCTEEPKLSSSPEPEDIEIFDLNPEAFDTESNVFDIDSMVNDVDLSLNEGKPLMSVTQEDILPPLNNQDNIEEEFAREYHKITVKCMQEEHDIKMKNMSDAHNLLKEEHKVKMKQMILEKDESHYRIKKLKLEILLLKSKLN